jgi:hypothetical protein
MSNDSTIMIYAFNGYILLSRLQASSWFSWSTQSDDKTWEGWLRRYWRYGPNHRAFLVLCGMCGKPSTIENILKYIRRGEQTTSNYMMFENSWQPTFGTFFRCYHALPLCQIHVSCFELRRYIFPNGSAELVNKKCRVHRNHLVRIQLRIHRWNDKTVMGVFIIQLFGIIDHW